MKNITKLVFLSVFAASAALSAATVAEQIKDADATLRKNFPDSGTVYDTHFIEEALTQYRAILKADGITAAEQAAVETKIANALIELDQVKEAETELLNALKTPGFTEKETAVIEIALSDLYFRTGEFAKAEPLLIKHKQGRRIIPCLWKTKGYAGVEDWVKNHSSTPIAIAEFYCENDKPELAVAIFEQNPKFRRERVIVNCYIRKGEFAKALAYAKKYAGESKEKNYYAELFLQGDNYTAIIRDKAFTQEIFDLAFQRDPELEKTLAAKYIDFQYACGNTAKVRELLAKLDPKAKTLRYAVMEAVLTGKDSAAQLAEQFKGKDQQEQANNLVKLAETAMEFKKEKFAREFWTMREKMLGKPTKPSLNCTFLADCPTDIAGFLAHRYTKDPKNVGTLNRKYGTNLQFLLDTDASTTGRKVTEDKGGADYTTFSAACNEQGVWLFFVLPCDKARAESLRNGSGAMGGFEMYVAPGFDEPYNTFLIECPPNETPGDEFMSQYNNATYRRATEANKNIKLTFRVDDDKVLMLMFLDWTTCINYVPQDGDFWEMEPLHWERGGLSWGGSESVHNRSSFGRLVFANMTPANRTSIMRGLLFKAKAAYQSECRANNDGRNGYLELWQDPELGDPEFNREVIVPLKEKYDAYAARIKPDMTDEEVNTVYKEAFRFMFNTRYMLEQARHNYLQKQMTQMD